MNGTRMQMRMINRPRCLGKTYMMVVTSYVTGSPIICRTEQNKTHILNVAREMGCTVNVYTLHEWNCIYGKDTKVLVDESKDIISAALEEYLGCGVQAVTLTLPMEGNCIED